MELITPNQWVIIFAIATSLTSCFRILLPALQGVFAKKLKNFWNDDWRLFIITITWLVVSTVCFPIFALVLIIPGLTQAFVKGLIKGLSDENSKV